MKEEKGITLIALIIYVILMTLAVAGVTAITNSLYSNVKDLDVDAKSAVDFAKFNMYFIKDIKSEGVKLVSCSENQIILSITNESGNNENISYSLQHGALYRNAVKICDNVQKAEISQGSSKNQILIQLKLNDYEKTTAYVLEPGESENQDVNM